MYEDHASATVQHSPDDIRVLNPSSPPLPLSFSPSPSRRLCVCVCVYVFSSRYRSPWVTSCLISHGPSSRGGRPCRCCATTSCPSPSAQQGWCVPLPSLNPSPSLARSLPPSHPSSLFLPTNAQLKPRFCPKPSLHIRISLTHTFPLIRCSAHRAQKSWARSSALKSATLFCKQGGSWSIPGSRARPSTALRTYVLLSSSSFAGLYARPSRRSFFLSFSTSFSLS